jgi:hypothetical protein
MTDKTQKTASGKEAEQNQGPKVVPGTETPPAPKDAVDYESLWLDPGLGDGITNMSYHDVPTGKPRDFFRTVPDPAYRRRTEIYTHKPEGAIDEIHYILAPAMRGLIDEAQPCTLVTVVYRDGSPRIWPVKLPKDGARDNQAWSTARSCAKAGLDRWVKPVWVRNSYKTRDAQPGYAPDPDFSKLPSFDDLIALAFGENGIIRDTNHPVYRELFGSKPQATDDDDAGDL